MKRFIYHYFCLIYSIAQLVFFIGCIDFWNRYAESDNLLSGSGIAGTILVIIILFASAVIDRFIRKVNNFGFVFDSIILTLILPLRAVFELITTIRLHIAFVAGDDSFAERGCDGSLFYLMFNCEGGVHISLPKKNKNAKSPKTKKEKVKEQPKVNKFETLIKKESITVEEEIAIGNKFLKENRRSDWGSSLYIIPLSNIEIGEPVHFSSENNNLIGNRFIDEIYINGIKIVYGGKIELAQALSLKPGFYDIKIHITGEQKSPSARFKTIKLNKYLSLNMVNIGNKETYLCVIYDFNEKTQEIKYSFNNVTEHELNKLCSYWDSGKQDILEAEIKNTKK